PVLRLDINDYDLLKNPDAIESIVSRISHMLKQTSHLRK
ncbi:deoxynucleoside kinase, partial [Lysinibacillus fusiformis]